MRRGDCGHGNTPGCSGFVAYLNGEREQQHIPGALCMWELWLALGLRMLGFNDWRSRDSSDKWSNTENWRHWKASFRSWLTSAIIQIDMTADAARLLQQVLLS